MKLYTLALLLLWQVLCLPMYAQAPITLSDIYEKGTFQESRIHGLNWMKDGRYLSELSSNKIIKKDILKEETDVILFDGSSYSLDIDDYSFSEDEKSILIETGKESIYRRSYVANYYIVNLTNKELIALSDKEKISYATFSPDGKLIAYVYQNNLYVINTEKKSLQVITKDGMPNRIINGSTDWVYEEEFGFAKAFYWSPDSKKIAYLKFDESEVPTYNMQYWVPSLLYPYDYKFKYPKAGETNATVSVHVFDVTSDKNTEIKCTEESDIYIPRIQWTTDSDLLSIRVLNRLQNEMKLIHANVSDNTYTTVLTESLEKGFIDINYSGELHYLKDGKNFVMCSEKDGYKHIYLYKLNGKEKKEITSGSFEVTDVLGLDEKSKTPLIYYLSTETSPLDRQMYVIDTQGKNKKRLTEKAGTYEVNMSTDTRFFSLVYSDKDTPPVTELYQNDEGTLTHVRQLKENSRLVEKCKSYAFGKKEFFSFTTKDGTTLNGYKILPSDFDPAKKYPLFMHVYGGPGSQLVTNSWAQSSPNELWHHMLTQKGYVVVCVDNRGTDGRGKSFKSATYANLGKYETQDQIEAAQHAISWGFIDPERVGIWGWSYGGYMTSLCMTVGADIFKTGIAVAPVTSWRFYDSVYTERYLMRPQDNASGYDDNSPITHANKLKGNFLLIHGTGDDNVHFQNSIFFQDALISSGKQFQSFFYPNRNHGIYGGNTRMHLYEMMTNFVMSNL